MKVTTPAYARVLGRTTRSIVRLIDRGLPAKKKSSAWEIVVAQADRFRHIVDASDVGPRDLFAHDGGQTGRDSGLHMVAGNPTIHSRHIDPGHPLGVARGVDD